MRSHATARGIHLAGKKLLSRPPELTPREARNLIGLESLGKSLTAVNRLILVTLDTCKS